MPGQTLNKIFGSHYDIKDQKTHSKTYLYQSDLTHLQYDSDNTRISPYIDETKPTISPRIKVINHWQIAIKQPKKK